MMMGTSGSRKGGHKYDDPPPPPTTAGTETEAAVDAEVATDGGSELTEYLEVSGASAAAAAAVVPAGAPAAAAGC